MHEPARLAKTTVWLPPASERLDIENSDTAPSRPKQRRDPPRRWLLLAQGKQVSVLLPALSEARLAGADPDDHPQPRGLPARQPPALARRIVQAHPDWLNDVERE